jgi:hypothetical protein
MTTSKFALAALSAALAFGLSGAAEAAKKKRAGQPIGQAYVAAGDNRASIQRAYPNDANPPSLRQKYNLRWRKMQEQRN